MRHGKKNNHLGRTSTHRKALLSNMATSLILNKRIATTVAKAKELRKYVEPLITRSKTDSTHSRRTVFSYLQNKESVHMLFSEVAEKIATRPGGYTRILRTGTRLGDNSDMCIIELVDYNDNYTKSTVTKAKTRRSRRGGKTTEGAVTEVVEAKDKTAKVEAKETAKAAEKKPEQEKEKDSE
jgi:large subunit ribosomal protein L17